MTAPGRLAKVAEVLHAEVVRQNPGHADWTNCPINGPCAEDAQALAPLLEGFRAEDEARALREAADKWQWGQWTALTPAVKAGSVIGAAQVVTDWLRARTVLGDEREAGR